MSDFDIKKLASQFTDVERARLYIGDLHRRHCGNGKCVLSDFETTMLEWMTNKGVLAKYAHLYADYCELARDVAQEYQFFELNFYRLDKIRFWFLLNGIVDSVFTSFSVIRQHTDPTGNLFLFDVTRFLNQFIILEENTNDNTVTLKENIAVFVKEQVGEMFGSACRVKTMLAIAEKVFNELGVDNADEEKNKIPTPKRYWDSVEELIKQHNTAILERTTDFEKECKHYLGHKEWVVYRKNVLNLNDYLIQEPKVDENLYAQLEKRLFKDIKK